MKKEKVLFLLVLLATTASKSYAYVSTLHYANTASDTFWGLCKGIGYCIIRGEMWVLGVD